MSADSADSWAIEVDRMTAAEAADLLREYERTVTTGGVGGAYAERIAETIADLDDALQNENRDSSNR